MNIIKTALFTKHDNKRYETDQQMLQRVGIKFGIIFFVMVMFDSLLDWTLGILHIVIHLMHLIIEAIEYSLVLLFTQMFQTSSHQSEIILINGLLIIALFLAYRLLNAAPRWYLRCKRNFRAACLKSLRRESSCWRMTTLTRKIKCISAYGVGTTCLLFMLS